MPSNSHSPKESLELRASDGELDGGQEALIPLLARTNGAEPVDDDEGATNEAPSLRLHKGRPNRQVRLYAVAGLTLVVFMTYAIVRSVSPARPSYASAKTSVPALDDLLGMLLHTTTPATLANDFLQHSDSRHVNLGVVPFSDRAFSPVYTPAPLEHALTTEGWSASCSETFVATGDLCAELRGGKDADRQVAMDVVWTWVNGSSSEILSDWMVRASQRGRKRTLSSVRHRRAGASVYRHFRCVISGP